MKRYNCSFFVCLMFSASVFSACENVVAQQDAPLKSTLKEEGSALLKPYMKDGMLTLVCVGASFVSGVSAIVSGGFIVFKSQNKAIFISLNPQTGTLVSSHSSPKAGCVGMALSLGALVVSAKQAHIFGKRFLDARNAVDTIKKQNELKV